MLTASTDGLRYTTSYHSNLNAQYLRKDFDAMMRKYSVIQLVISSVDTEEVRILKEEYEDYCQVLACQVQKINQVGFIHYFRASSLKLTNE
jgi:hypothetical protein